MLYAVLMRPGTAFILFVLIVLPILYDFHCREQDSPTELIDRTYYREY